MNKTAKRYTVILIAWIAIIILSIITMPNVSKLVADKGQIKIPNTAKSQVAKTIQKDWGHGISNTRQVVLVFNNGNKKITDSQQKNINNTISNLNKHKNKYDIKRITAPQDNDTTKKQLISRDHTTQLVQLDVGKRDSVEKMNEDISKFSKTKNVKTYVTGSDILTDDFRLAAEKGLKKTEVIAVIFILVVLIIVFRSPIIPLISLSTVGVGFFVSLNFVMNLAKLANFTISDFTQLFMVVVLFGIGTDYNILLFNQFKNDLNAGMKKEAATIHSLKVAGRTIIYSGSAVFIGFATLGLAQFSIYRSTVGVAVGVAVLLASLLTINPFFMAVFGDKIFWPSHNHVESEHNKIWNWLSSHSVAHPFIAILFALLITIPFVATYNSQLNFDDVAELPAGVSSKQGFKVVQNHFTKGTAEPTTVYIKSKHTLNNNQDLKEIDRITKQLQDESKIKTVASVTQPGGEPINELYVNNQLASLTEQTKNAQSGLSEIQKGTSSTTFDTTQLEDIGTNAENISTQLQAIQTTSGSSASGEEVLSQLQQRMTQSGHPLTQEQLQILGSSLNEQQSATTSINNRLQAIAGYTQAIGNDANGVGKQLQGTQEKSQSASAGLSKINGGMTSANDYLKKLQDSSSSDTLYIPNSVVTSAEFKQSMENYMSENNKSTKLTVVLKTDPSSKSSLNEVKHIQTEVKNNLKGTSLKNATVAVGGQSSETADVQTTANNDFTRTAMIMLIGITIALMFITRSILQPIYIIGTLLLAYITSLSITRLFSSAFLGEDTLTWKAPFFIFVMLVALGVDYSIFLMMKYRENKSVEPYPSQQIVKASSQIGTVVISAAIILGGTFAALIPSNVLTLLQVAIGVISGLIILVFLIPVVNSSLIKLTYPNTTKNK